ncbi:hypothetical protein DOTSEDRAFT_26846 [Dothistroma septosporum NZE10]|uniref:Uncharacterized protein n=1 Tax=Dothistroma septosporum (strain NZE10 / CBS 128990) TaxID=675120 RepID=N1PHX9_DOTSN|nr:hypothetical protein DOTSEDRAFT_26846 [Dothistroma septosporum NZE10]
MARTKPKPISKRSSKRKPQAEKTDYSKEKNDKLIAEFKKRGLPKPGRVNKNNLIAVLEQNDREAAASRDEAIKKNPLKDARELSGNGKRGRRVKTAGRLTEPGVREPSEPRTTARPGSIRTKPHAPLARLKLLQEFVLDIAGWVIDEDDDRLNRVIRILGRADRELARLLIQSPPTASLPERASSVGVEGTDARPPQKRRFDSLGAVVAPAPKLKASPPGQVGWDPVIGDTFNLERPSTQGTAVDEGEGEFEAEEDDEEVESEADGEGEEPAEGDGAQHLDEASRALVHFSSDEDD